MSEKLSGVDIVRKYTNGKLSTRPEFYSGRGAILGDLNSEILEMVYKGVRAEYGDAAAATFVQFVADEEKLSATRFLNAFFSFIARGCRLNPAETHSDTDVGPDNGGRMAIGMATIAGAMFGDSERDSTPSIRGPFLRAHKDEYKPRPGGVEDGFGHMYYSSSGCWVG